MEDWIVALIAIVGIPAALCLILLLAKLIIILTTGYYVVEKNLSGKTVIITGGNTGIGKETALQLAAKGARVIIGCRNTSKGRAAQEEISEKTGNHDVVCRKLDLCSFKSVRFFADEILGTEERIDILINNAGMNTPPTPQYSEDGFETTLQANHLGHFLLTNLLLDLLIQSAPSRIVVLGSVAAWNGIGNPKDLKSNAEAFHPFIVYGRSKTFNMLFTVELAERLKGTGVTVNALHPGLVNSEFFRDHGEPRFNPFRLNARMYGKSVAQGAMTSLFVATSDKLEGVSGKYFSDCSRAFPPPWATSKSRAKTLWDSSLKAVGLDDP